MQDDIIQAVSVFDLLTPDQLAEVAQEEESFGISSSGFPPSTASIGGHTLDTYIIANTASMPLRAFWNAGKLTPLSENVVEDAQTRTTYSVSFTDRDRVIIVTEETYRVMVEDSYPQDEAPDSAGIERIQTSIDPLVQDRMSSLESAIDGRGNAKPFNADTRFPARAHPEYTYRNEQ
jgi:hypothetical protein